MAYKSTAADLGLRERRQRAYQAAAVLGDRFPKVSEIVIELRFAEPDGKPLMSPYHRVFAPDMQAFFDVQCPGRECSGGGFDLSDHVARAVSSSDSAATGTVKCMGRRPRPGADTDRCHLALNFHIAAVKDRPAGR